MKLLNTISVILLAGFMTPGYALELGPSPQTWDKPELGIRFTVLGPFLFFGDQTNLGTKTTFVKFGRQGKGKRGLVTVKPMPQTYTPLKQFDFKNSELYKNLKNASLESKITFKAGQATAMLMVFSYDEFGPRSDVRGTGFLIMSDYNNLRYRIWALNQYGNDPVADQELGEIIRTLEISTIKN